MSLRNNAGCRSLLFATTLFAIVACGGGSGSDPAPVMAFTPTPIDPLADADTTFVITPAGGRFALQLATGDAELVVPPGAVTAAVEVGASAVTDQALAAIFPAISSPLAAIDFQPDGLSFEAAVELHVLLPPGSAETQVTFGANRSGGGIEAVPVSIRHDIAANTVTAVALVEHFSTVVVADTGITFSQAIPDRLMVGQTDTIALQFDATANVAAANFAPQALRVFFDGAPMPQSFSTLEATGDLSDIVTVRVIGTDDNPAALDDLDIPPGIQTEDSRTTVTCNSAGAERINAVLQFAAFGLENQELITPITSLQCDAAEEPDPAPGEPDLEPRPEPDPDEGDGGGGQPDDSDGIFTTTVSCPDDAGSVLITFNPDFGGPGASAIELNDLTIGGFPRLDLITGIDNGDQISFSDVALANGATLDFDAQIELATDSFLISAIQCTTEPQATIPELPDGITQLSELLPGTNAATGEFSAAFSCDPGAVTVNFGTQSTQGSLRAASLDDPALAFVLTRNNTSSGFQTRIQPRGAADIVAVSGARVVDRIENSLTRTGTLATAVSTTGTENLIVQFAAPSVAPGFSDNVVSPLAVQYIIDATSLVDIPAGAIGFQTVLMNFDIAGNVLVNELGAAFAGSCEVDIVFPPEEIGAQPTRFDGVNDNAVSANLAAVDAGYTFGYSCRDGEIVAATAPPLFSEPVIFTLTGGGGPINLPLRSQTHVLRQAVNFTNDEDIVPDPTTGNSVTPSIEVEYDRETPFDFAFTEERFVDGAFIDVEILFEGTVVANEAGAALSGECNF